MLSLGIKGEQPIGVCVDLTPNTHTRTDTGVKKRHWETMKKRNLEEMKGRGQGAERSGRTAAAEE